MNKIKHLEKLQAACSEVESLYNGRVYPLNHAEQVAIYCQIKAGRTGVFRE
jgi:hypothetical protein